MKNIAKIYSVYILISLFILILSVATHITEAKQNGDLFVSIAAGRDITTGNLAKPDDWSFMTDGKVWINQNWGTGLILYYVFSAFSFNGLIIFKVALIILLAAAIVALIRSRNIRFSEAFLTTALILSVTQSYTNLRANLFSLIFAPLLLWLLNKSLNNQIYLYISGILVILWSNIHGGYSLGLLMLILWTASIFFSCIIKKAKLPIKILVTTFSTIIFTIILNPFGVESIKNALLVGTSTTWRSVAEWTPIWDKAGFGNIPGFIVVLVLALLLFVINYTKNNIPNEKTHSAKKNRSKTSNFQLDRIYSHDFFFHFSLYSLVIIAAFYSRRFIPVALIIIAPFIANQISNFLNNFKSHWVALFFSILIAIHPALKMSQDLKFFRPDYPFNNAGTLFEKMHVMSSEYPVNLVNFINANGIDGKIMNEWRWEGYLRLNAPQLKLFYGGRAQQIYDEKTYLSGLNFFAGKDSLTLLRSHDVNMVAITFDQEKYSKLLNALLNKGNYAIIYMDGDNMLLVNKASAQGQTLINKALEGKLLYPNPKIAALSESACKVSPAIDFDKSKAVDSLSFALKNLPCSWGYLEMSRFVGLDPQTTQMAESFLQSELKAIKSAGISHPKGFDYVASRDIISYSLAQYYKSVFDREKFDLAKEENEECKKLEEEMLQNWPK